VAEALGINATDLRCLDILAQRGPLTAGQLAEAMHLSSGMIDFLEQGSEMVERELQKVEPRPTD
jgi:predicted transcriptional regulator